MHGSSSVPQELLAEIREFGGNMKDLRGSSWRDSRRH
jgi:fructose-bisphosphate aldolase class II